MFSKKEFRFLLFGAVAIFFIITLLVYMTYINFKPKKTQLRSNFDQYTEQSYEEEKQMVIAYDVDKIEANTNIIFEIVDQLGILIQTNLQQGINWIDMTKDEMLKLYPDYELVSFTKDQVVLRKVIKRQTEPDYVLTKRDGHIIMAIKQNGQMLFYKDIGLEEHDFTDKLGEALAKGISITAEQKEIILENAEELYMILQEYDE